MASFFTSKQYPWSVRILGWIVNELAKHIVLVFTALIGSYVLAGAIALAQPAGAAYPTISVWILVIGNAPFLLGFFLVLTSPIWGRKGRPRAECGRCGSKEACIDEEGKILCVWCDD